ncbi:actinia tenebrosa protease inhibitors-like [Centropristis striata]|uniref:actinia tenebrosa protease inhibitors-like n=1 Tax=Centropristis striata TaxID=184440 RepID=UPI0027E0C92D|nr:actinia tenebrosa protease inhibitors-like [Centropristis striata]
MKGVYHLADEKLRCSDPMKDSSCDSKSPRFFYNKNTRGCEQVTSGCGSNRNTFDTRGACETFCNERRVCYLPVAYGENPSAGHSGGPQIRAEPDAKTIRGKPDANAPHNFFFHNMSSFRCEGFHFRGSASNGNIFSTVEECESHCGDVKARCFDFMEDRSCKPRFFYNKNTRGCEQVTRGCGSNRNTFDTREACETFCNERRVCYRPVEYGEYPSAGHSGGLYIRGKPDANAPHNFFFHNMSSFRCEGFHFRGSASNGNIFSTVEECESHCGDVKARCFDFMEDRSCKPRFFYNSTSYRCEQLSSGGCGSKKNAFDTRDGCEALCNEKYRCYQPVEHGHGPFRLNHYSIPLSNFFFYNVLTLKCEGFQSRGMGSNGNIFRTVEECERLCGDVKGKALPPVPYQTTRHCSDPVPAQN